MRDFSLEAYKCLLTAISCGGIPVFGVADWLRNKPASGIMLRHDVDRKPFNALRIAELEREFDIVSTYYFRITKSSFNKEIIERISSLGHEIGYHYEDLSLVKGNYDKAIKLFEKHLERIRAIAPVETIAMHGRPLSVYDNRDLWQKYNYKNYGIVGEAFVEVDYSDMYYFTDTGRSWNPGAANLRDKVDFALSENISTTDELIDFIRENNDKKIAIVSHPERWARNMFDYYSSLSFDLSVNVIKGLIKIVRNDK